MKKFLFLLPFLCLYSFSQEKTIHEHKGKVDYYIDSVKVDYNKIHLDPKNIKSFNIKKTGNRNGNIYITLKKKKRLKSLLKIKKQKIHKIKKTLFIIDEELIISPSEVLMHEEAIGSIEIIEVPKIINLFLNYTIVKITTKIALQRIEDQKKGVIRIRGNSFSGI